MFLAELQWLVEMYPIIDVLRYGILSIILMNSNADKLGSITSLRITLFNANCTFW